MRRDLFVVSRYRPDLYECLKQEFSHDASVEVVLDRRLGERRWTRVPFEPERRRAERRRFAEAASLRSLDFALVTVAEPSDDAADADGLEPSNSSSASDPQDPPRPR